MADVACLDPQFIPIVTPLAELPPMSRRNLDSLHVERAGMNDGLKIDRHGRVTLFIINRPERRNAFTTLATTFEEAVAEFNRDNSQRVLIITGAGDKAFC